MPVPEPARLLKLLKKENVLPLKRKELEGKVKSWFPKLDAPARLALEDAGANVELVRGVAQRMKARVGAE